MMPNLARYLPILAWGRHYDRNRPVVAAWPS